MNLWLMSTSRVMKAVECPSDAHNLRAPRSLDHRVDVRFSMGEIPGWASGESLSRAHRRFAVDAPGRRGSVARRARDGVLDLSDVAGLQDQLVAGCAQEFGHFIARHLPGDEDD